MFELRDGAAVERARRDDVVARLQHREQGSRLRGKPTGESHATGAAFEAGNTFFEGRHRGVHDA